MQKSSKSSRLLFFIFPFRDSVGFTWGAPFRIGEIYSVIYSFCLFFSKRKYYIPSIDNRINNIFILLSLNFIISFLICLYNWGSVDHPFAIKYLLRNLLTIFLLVAIWKKFENFSEELIDKGVKWNIVLQLFAALIFFVFAQKLYMNQLLSIWAIGTGEYGGVEIPRFSGTASECGYLGPMLALPLYYFLSVYKRNIINKLCLYFCVALLVLSTSLFNYFLMFLCVFLFYYHKNKVRTIYITLCFVFGLIFLSSIILVALKDSIVGAFLDMSINKAIGFITFGAFGEMDFSANDRSEHLLNAIYFFGDGNFFEYLFGHGSGAYYYYATNHSSTLIEDVSEAYNLYLSTLTDRGIFGLFLFVLVMRSIYRIKSNNYISNAIWFGILSQLIHYMLVGNMWLYFLWQEVVFLIGYERYLVINGLARYENRNRCKNFK